MGRCPLPWPACHLRVSLFPGACPWSNLMAILEQRNGADTELLVYTMTLINKVWRGWGGWQGQLHDATLAGLGVGRPGPSSVPLVLFRRWQPSRTRTPSTT